MSDFLNNTIMTEFIRAHFMDGSLGHLYLAYFILNIVWAFILKAIYDVNDRMTKRLGIEKDSFDTVGFYPLAFSWLGPLGSIVMLFFTIPVLIGSIIMLLDTIDALWNELLNLFIPNKTNKNVKDS